MRALTRNRALAAVRGVTPRLGSQKRIASGLSAALRAQGIRLDLEIVAPKKRGATYLTQADFARLVDQLPSHQRSLALFAILTGLRAGNVRKLRWENVSGAHLVFWGSEMKAGEDHVVPLSREAQLLLEAQRGVHPEWVFPYRYRGTWAPVSQISTKAWRAARARAGLPTVRFHDLRHTWARWQAEAGTPILAIKEMGGWKTLAMVAHYARFSADTRGYAARVGTKVRTLVKRTSCVRLKKPGFNGGAEGDRTLDLRIANGAHPRLYKKNQ
jgi:integrase